MHAAIAWLAIILQSIDQNGWCSHLHSSGSIPGRVLIVLSDRGQPPQRRACVVSRTQVTGVSLPHGDELAGATIFVGGSWGSLPDQVFLVFCSSNTDPRRYCRVVLSTLSGHFIRRYPDSTATDIADPDGRLRRLVFGGPRISPVGDLLAVQFEDTVQVLRVADSVTVRGIQPASMDYVWSPDAKEIAYTRAPITHRGTTDESQLFLHDLRTRTDRQLTHLEPKDFRPWWKVFAPPLFRNPVVSGVTWASRANIIGFYVAGELELHLWNPDGNEIKAVPLEGKCFRDTHLDPNAESVMYLDASSAERCLSHAWDQIRLANLKTGKEQVVVALRDNDLGIEEIDWAFDSTNPQ